jgi:hypothetical protein
MAKLKPDRPSSSDLGACFHVFFYISLLFPKSRPHAAHGQGPCGDYCPHHGLIHHGKVGMRATRSLKRDLFTGATGGCSRRATTLAPPLGVVNKGRSHTSAPTDLSCSTLDFPNRRLSTNMEVYPTSCTSTWDVGRMKLRKMKMDQSSWAGAFFRGTASESLSPIADASEARAAQTDWAAGGFGQRRQRDSSASNGPSSRPLENWLLKWVLHRLNPSALIDGLRQGPSPTAFEPSQQHWVGIQNYQVATFSSRSAILKLAHHRIVFIIRVQTTL